MVPHQPPHRIRSKKKGYPLRRVAFFSSLNGVIPWGFAPGQALPSTDSNWQPFNTGYSTLFFRMSEKNHKPV